VPGTILRAADRDTDLEVSEGDTFEVRLPENASTGFQWSVTALPPGVELVEDALDLDVGARPGGEAEHRFAFRVSGAGSGQLGLELRRSWETRSEPEARFAVRMSPRTGDRPAGDEPDPATG
jgi:inhibitor of cysteine peptidase